MTSMLYTCIFGNLRQVPGSGKALGPRNGIGPEPELVLWLTILVCNIGDVIHDVMLGLRPEGPANRHGKVETNTDIN